MLGLKDFVGDTQGKDVLALWGKNQLSFCSDSLELANLSLLRGFVAAR